METTKQVQSNCEAKEVGAFVLCKKCKWAVGALSGDKTPACQKPKET